MSPRKKESKEVLRSEIKNLIFQEVRLLRLERTFTPHLITEAESQSIQEAKRNIVRWAQAIALKERAVLLKKMVREVLDEEIDRAIQLRKTRCLRCIHMRYYDRKGTPRVHLPIDARQAQVIGCDIVRTSIKAECQRFEETVGSSSLEDYLSGMALLYELREMLERFEEIWEDYLLL